MRRKGLPWLGLSILGVLLLTFAQFAGGTAKADPPGNDGVCEHAQSEKPCRPDPQPDHGKDCEDHGANFDGNEDHCLLTSPTTQPTESPTQPTQPSTPTTVATGTATSVPTGTPTSIATTTPTSVATTTPTVAPTGTTTILVTATPITSVQGNVITSPPAPGAPAAQPRTSEVQAVQTTKVPSLGDGGLLSAQEQRAFKTLGVLLTLVGVGLFSARGFIGERRA